MSELYIKQELLKALPQTDAVILDIDGVVLDVSQSYRVVIGETAQYYATQVMQLEDNGTLLPLSQIELFKMAGGFNSDWDLTNAAVAFIVAKQAQTEARETKALAESELDWKQFTADIKRRGGGLAAAEAVILEFLTSQQRREFARNWNQKLVTQLFQEMYGGDACQSLYGFEPEHIHVEGFYKRESVLLDVAALPEKIKVGALTGRTRNEAKLALKVAGLSARIPENLWVTEDDGVRKPDGRTLLLAQEKMQFRNAIFIGDTMDDMQTVFNYRELKGSGRARVWSSIVLSGPSGDAHRRTFLEAGTEIIAPDANAILQYLGSVLK